MANRFCLNPTSYHGFGAIEQIVPTLQERKCKKALIVTDASLVKFGVVANVTKLLDAAHFPYAVYDEVKPNPTIQNVKDGVKAYEKEKADCIIAIGGGSSMDTAKGIGIIVNNPEFADVRSLEGVAPTKNHAVFTIAVPTTAGTAAEVTINYVITDEEKHRKFVCVDTHDLPDVAVVDPTMMLSMPKRLTAATGMDALTHAIEGLITKGAWEMSDMFHLEAIRIISHNLRASVNGSGEEQKKAREEMALGQYIAGMGFSNVGLGMVHSMAHPLSALYDTPHGEACSRILPAGMKFNAPYTGTKYREICRVMDVPGYEKMSQEEYREAAIQAVCQLSHDVGIENNVKGIVKEEDLDFLASSAMADACMPGNPAPISKEDVIKVYKSLM